MFEVNKILHPTDFSECSKHALAHAVRMARRHDAVLHLLNVAPGMGDDPVRTAFSLGAGEEADFETIAEQTRARMGELAEAAGTDDLDVSFEHRRGIAPGPVINDYASEQDIDLIVMGTHGRRGVGRFVLGSVAEEVVRQAPCSVMTVRADDTGTPPPTIDRMLVPVDLSEFTVPLHRAALEVAATYSAHIDLLHVIEPLPFPVPLVGAVTIHDLVPDPTERSTEQLTRLVETVRHPDVSVTPHVTEGHAARSIIQQADALGADLIMMASHGLSGIEGFLLGSVTARVARRARCPVLVARVEPEKRPDQHPAADDAAAPS
jgi:nucleotide-binding universal stress UspA family protein